jgi:hypothetical protein
LRIGALAIGIVSLGLLGACGSSASSASRIAPASACVKLAAVLSDGPDPSEDPIGYAEAQIGPLRQIHTSDMALQVAVGRLDAAYATLFEHSRSAAAKTLVREAVKSVNALCPGAAGQ